MTAEITYFPKRCHLHSLPMVWEDIDGLSSGWKCPKCTLTCPAHKDPMRSGIGALYPVGAFYCRRCRTSRIYETARKKRDPSWRSEPLPAESGVAHIWRNPDGSPTPRIVKVQRALYDSSSILVYDKPIRQGRSEVHEIFAQLPMSAGDIAALLGDDLKGYFEARLLPSFVHGESTIEIGDRVPDEDW